MRLQHIHVAHQLIVLNLRRITGCSTAAGAAGGAKTDLYQNLVFVVLFALPDPDCIPDIRVDAASLALLSRDSCSSSTASIKTSSPNKSYGLLEYYLQYEQVEMMEVLSSEMMLSRSVNIIWMWC
jgi:hypothetical protein